jgi:hypothetical protein
MLLLQLLQLEMLVEDCCYWVIENQIGSNKSFGCCLKLM